MASCKRLFVYLLLVFAITLITEIGDVEGRGGRGGGGGGRSGGGRSGGSRGGSRGGSSGGSRGSRGGRGNSISRSGSSPYTRSTFTTALTAGYIYGSVRYMRTSRYRSYPNEIPTICTNNFDQDSNGTTYGYFICPRAGEPEDYEYCCGDAKREHCCEYQSQVGQMIGIIVGAIAGGMILFVLFYCCAKHALKKLGDKKIKSNRQGSYGNTRTSAFSTPAPTMTYSNSDPPTSTAFTTPASDNPYGNKPPVSTGYDTTPAYDDRTVPPYSLQPTSDFTYSPAPVATAPIGFEYSDPAQYPTPPSYSQAVNQPGTNV